MSRGNDLFERDLEEFNELLTEIRDFNKKQTSLKANFWRGIVYGFGFFIGSAVIATLLIYILASLRIDGNTYMGKFIESIINIVDKSRR